MALINVNNQALALPFGNTKALINFSTDANAGITSTITSGANSNTATLASGTGFNNGDWLTIVGGGIAAANWYQQILTINGTALTLNTPSVITAVSAAAVSRWERFETRFKPSAIKLTNLGTLEEYVWRKGMATRSAVYTTAAGAKSIVTGNTIWCATTAFGIHPAILPISSTFQIELDFTYGG